MIVFKGLPEYILLWQRAFEFLHYEKEECSDVSEERTVSTFKVSERSIFEPIQSP
jgi:hypothetical protein